MCTYYDDGERCEVWRETQRLARIAHRCDCCGRTIAARTLYVRHFSVYESDSCDEKCCIECDAARRTFSAAHGNLEFVPSEFLHELYYCITEGDEESERLWRPMIAAIKQRGGTNVDAG